MSLIATARALDDARFLWRVNAATLTTAATKVKDSTGRAQVFAEYVLDNPMQHNATMAALVACSPAIASVIDVDDFNTVNTEDVTDQDILYVVATSWDTVADRHAERTSPSVAAPGSV